MREKCRYCKRERFETNADYEADIDAKENKCGRDVAGREGSDDCMSHRLHRCQMRRLRAEGLLRTASMLHLMGEDYRKKFQADYAAFLDEWKEEEAR